MSGWSSRLVRAAVVLGACLLCSAGLLAWARTLAARKQAAHVSVHRTLVDTHGTSSEARGRHLVEVRYICVQCHAADCGGGVMVGEPLLAVLRGPNLTRGHGSVTAHYSSADWDRAVRHGVRNDGTPLLMPSQDFAAMSDRELADIVAYLDGLPPVDRVIEPSSLGPIGAVLLATGLWRLAPEIISQHHAPHRTAPPSDAASVELGELISGVCKGCHGENLAGGKIILGDPRWPVASNLTPHAAGLAAWQFADFARAMRHGSRPDGRAMRAPMTLMTPYTAKLTDLELRALWLYLSSLPPQPSGG